MDEKLAETIQTCEKSLACSFASTVGDSTMLSAASHLISLSKEEMLFLLNHTFKTTTFPHLAKITVVRSWQISQLSFQGSNVCFTLVKIETKAHTEKL